MNHKPATVATIIVLLLPAACTGSTPDQDVVPSVSAGGPESPANSAEPTPTLDQRLLRGKNQLVNPFSGEADATTPPFQPSANAFTIYFVCADGGKISMTVEEQDPLTYPCDGVTNVSQVFTERRTEQRLKVRVEGEGRWQIAVIDGVAR